MTIKALARLQATKEIAVTDAKGAAAYITKVFKNHQIDAKVKVLSPDLLEANFKILKGNASITFSIENDKVIVSSYGLSISDVLPELNYRDIDSLRSLDTPLGSKEIVNVLQKARLRLASIASEYLEVASFMNRLGKALTVLEQGVEKDKS